MVRAMSDKWLLVDCQNCGARLPSVIQGGDGVNLKDNRQECRYCGHVFGLPDGLIGKLREAQNGIDQRGQRSLEFNSANPYPDNLNLAEVGRVLPARLREGF
jgi:hypothetical protein